MPANQKPIETTDKDDYVEEALNIAIAYLQKQFGITEGDYASHFFDEETAEKIKTIFKDYIEGELDHQFSGESE